MAEAPLGEAALSQRLDQLKSYLSYDQNNISLLLEIIALSIDIQRWDDAETFIHQGLKAHPESAEINAHAGFYFLRTGEIEKAKSSFGIAVESGLKDPAVVYNWAYAHFLLEDFAGANEVLAKIDENNQVEREKALLSARCQYHLGDLTSAIDQLTAICRAENKDAQAEALLSIILYDNDQSDKALYHANQVLQSDSPPVEAYLARGGVYMEQGLYDEAYGDFYKATQASPTLGRAWSGVGQIELNNFEFDQARTSLEKAVEFMPNHIGTWHALGWVRLLQNEVEEAKMAFEAAYDLDRNFGETHGGLASVYALQGDDEQAERHRKLAERLDPNGVSQHYAQLVLLNRAGKIDEAKKLVEDFRETEHPTLGVKPGDLIDKRVNALIEKSQKKPN